MTAQDISNKTDVWKRKKRSRKSKICVKSIKNETIELFTMMRVEK